VFFGLVATVGTFYVQTLRLDQPVVWAAAAAVGLLATALLLANNLRDIDTDRVTGKHTLAVRVGRRRAGWCYIGCVLLPFAGVLVWAVLSTAGAVHAARPAIALLPLVALPLSVAPIRLVNSDASGRELLPVLAGTGRLQLVFGILLSVALWLWIA
jgi:1,4-dihydroxy-2-naphthoate polyprenyltransferase